MASRRRGNLDDAGLGLTHADAERLRICVTASRPTLDLRQPASASAGSEEMAGALLVCSCRRRAGVEVRVSGPKQITNS